MRATTATFLGLPTFCGAPSNAAVLRLRDLADSGPLWKLDLLKRQDLVYLCPFTSYVPLQNVPRFRRSTARIALNVPACLLFQGLSSSVRPAGTHRRSSMWLLPGTHGSFLRSRHVLYDIVIDVHNLIAIREFNARPREPSATPKLARGLLAQQVGWSVLFCAETLRRTRTRMDASYCVHVCMLHCDGGLLALLIRCQSRNSTRFAWPARAPACELPTWL